MPRTRPMPETSLVYILVMGITGAGKSTFIQNATGDTGIKVGDGLQSETKEVQESIVIMEDTHGKPLEVHLIDTPGFDDDFDSDPDVLRKIAYWTNSLFDRKEKISGVLYLHDVSLRRIRGSGLRNLEMLPELIGKEKLEFLTLVTTHWGTLKDPSREVNNEESLRKDGKYWKTLLEGRCSRATMRRFENTAESALGIIKEHVQHKFVPSLTHEMVIQSLPLDHTSAGKIVRKNLDEAYHEALRKAARDTSKLAALEKRYELVKERLRERFDTQRALEYQLKAERMKTKQRVFRTVRWVARASAVAGVVTVIVLTSGVAAPALATLPLVEAWAQAWSANDKRKQEMQKAESDGTYEADFRAFQKKQQLEEEDVADIESVFEDDDSDKRRI